MPRKPCQLRLYRERKASGLCVGCGAGLQEADGDRCVECVAQHAAWRASESGRASHAASMQRYRTSKIARGECLDCKLPALEGKRCCETHLLARADVQDRRRAA